MWMDHGGEITASSLLEHQAARVLGLAHEVHHALRALVLRWIFQVEVEIDLGAAVVQMRRHRVPDAAGLEHRQAEQQLRGAAGRGHDVLIDRALVRRLQRAPLQRHGLVDRDLHRLEARVRRRGNEIELRGRARRARLERHVLRAHRHVQPVTRREIECLAVECHAASRLADVDDAELAPLEERLAGCGRRFGLVRQAQRARCGRGAADHEALVVRVVESDRIGREQAFDQVAVAQLLVAGAGHHVGMRCVIGLFEHERGPQLDRMIR